MIVQFVLIGEGSSDNALLSHLENVCLELGAEEVTGIELDFRRLPEKVKRTVDAKLSAAMRLEPHADLFLIHRDADAQDPQPRFDEITKAAEKCRCQRPCVAIVPVQETEAWLLLDENAIRSVANRPRGRTPLDLPSPETVEGQANPKEILKNAIAVASETTGNRRDATNARFSQNRRILLQNLPVDGPIRHVPAWKRMYAELGRALDAIKGADDVSG